MSDHISLTFKRDLANECCMHLVIDYERLLWIRLCINMIYDLYENLINNQVSAHWSTNLKLAINDELEHKKHYPYESDFKSTCTFY